MDKDTYMTRPLKPICITCKHSQFYSHVIKEPDLICWPEPKTEPNNHRHVVDLAGYCEHYESK